MYKKNTADRLLQMKGLIDFLPIMNFHKAFKGKTQKHNQGVVGMATVSRATLNWLLQLSY